MKQPAVCFLQKKLPPYQTITPKMPWSESEFLAPKFRPKLSKLVTPHSHVEGIFIGGIDAPSGQKKVKPTWSRTPSYLRKWVQNGTK